MKSSFDFCIWHFLTFSLMLGLILSIRFCVVYDCCFSLCVGLSVHDTAVEEQDDYLAPQEVKPSAHSPQSPPASTAAAPSDTYLPPVELTKARASSTFGVGKEVDTNIGDMNPYAGRKEANPYASRQQMKLPATPANENPYQSRKQAQPLPKAPDSNPYASRQQMQLPPLPTQAPTAPMAPKAPGKTHTPQEVDTQSIYVQRPDAVSLFFLISPDILMRACSLNDWDSSSAPSVHTQFLFNNFLLLPQGVSNPGPCK